MIVALKEIAVTVEDFPRAFDMRLVPVCFNLRPVWKGNDSKTIFLAINKIALIKRVVRVMILAFAVLFALAPHAIINIPVWVFHPPLAMLHVIPPFSFVNIPICVGVSSVALLAVFHNSLITFPIPEEIIPVDQGVILPCAEVYIPVVVDVNTEIVALAVGIQLTIVETAIEILFLD